MPASPASRSPPPSMKPATTTSPPSDHSSQRGTRTPNPRGHDMSTTDHIADLALPRSIELSIGGMTCASCAARIEKKLNKLDGVSATVNYATEKAKISYPDS